MWLSFFPIVLISIFKELKVWRNHIVHIFKMIITFNFSNFNTTMKSDFMKSCKDHLFTSLWNYSNSKIIFSYIAGMYLFNWSVNFFISLEYNVCKSAIDKWTRNVAQSSFGHFHLHDILIFMFLIWLHQSWGPKFRSCSCQFFAVTQTLKNCLLRKKPESVAL